MTPYDGARLGKALKAKVLIPDHWENWANSSSDPDMLVRQFEDCVQIAAQSAKLLLCVALDSSTIHQIRTSNVTDIQVRKKTSVWSILFTEKRHNK